MSDAEADRRAARRRFLVPLAAILFAGYLLRLAYLFVQPATDPSFAIPMLDGEIYTRWARSLAAGDGSPAGLLGFST